MKGLLFAIVAFAIWGILIFITSLWMFYNIGSEAQISLMTITTLLSIPFGLVVGFTVHRINHPR